MHGHPERARRQRALVPGAAERGDSHLARRDATGGNFLDLRGRISTGGERGLLGLAFPPQFAERRYFYVNYTNPAGNTVVSRFRVSGSNENQADANSEQVLLTVNQPFPNHNGGQLQFGPDGMLYIGLGDGGSANDPQNHGQNPQSLLGKCCGFRWSRIWRVMKCRRAILL